MIKYSDLLNNPTMIYYGVYIKPMYVYKYGSGFPEDFITELMKENNITNYSNTTKFLDEIGYKFYDLVKLHSIYLLELDTNFSNKIIRNFKIFKPKEDNDYLVEFNTYVENMSNDKFFVGYDLMYELSIIIRTMVEKGIKVNSKLISLLDGKPWDNDFIDIRQIWKNLDVYGNKSTFSSILTSLGLEIDGNSIIRNPIPMNELFSHTIANDYNNDMIEKNGISYVNQYARVLKKLRDNR